MQKCGFSLLCRFLGNDASTSGNFFTAPKTGHLKMYPAPTQYSYLIVNWDHGEIKYSSVEQYRWLHTVEALSWDASELRCFVYPELYVRLSVEGNFTSCVQSRQEAPRIFRLFLSSQPTDHRYNLSKGQNQLFQTVEEKGETFEIVE